MPMTSKDMEKLILADGWILKSQVGSHRQYIHPTKKLRFLYIQKT